MLKLPKKNGKEKWTNWKMEPPNMYKSNVLNQTKKEYVDSELNVELTDGIWYESLKRWWPLHPTLNLYKQSNPFFIFYMTIPQLHAYNEYCRLQKWLFINIDTIGSIIQTIKWSDNTETGHMFLSAIVINFDNTTLIVCQMISERHTTEFIKFWLRT